MNDLREMRRTAGLSQQRLAELAHCSLAAVALFEGGYRPARSIVLPRIINVLNESSPAGEPGSTEARPRETAGHRVGRG
jgi:predicted transcriptional regulator